jgi:hypothetical protein
MKWLLYIVLFFLSDVLLAQEKVFHQPDAKGQWQYVYPFADKTYVVAIQYGINYNEEDGLKTSNIYFGKIGKTDKVFWKEQLQMRLINDNIQYQDYNNDGVKDLLIFEDTGARGGNSYYNLYFLNPINHTIKKVVDFNKIVNPSYNKKHKVIIGYGLVGNDVYVSIYKINANNQAYQIGKSFKETDELDLDKKITSILKKKAF